MLHLSCYEGSTIGPLQSGERWGGGETNSMGFTERYKNPNSVLRNYTGYFGTHLTKNGLGISKVYSITEKNLTRKEREREREVIDVLVSV